MPPCVPQTGLDTLAASQLLRGLRDRELLRLHPHGAQSYYALPPILLQAADTEQMEAASTDGGKLGADRGRLDPGSQTFPEDLLTAIDQLGSRPRKEFGS